MRPSTITLIATLALGIFLDVCFVSPAPVERHACARRHPVPRALTPGFPLPRE